MFTKSHKNGITTLQPVDKLGNADGPAIKIKEEMGAFLRRIAVEDHNKAVAEFNK